MLDHSASFLDAWSVRSFSSTCTVLRGALARRCRLLRAALSPFLAAPHAAVRALVRAGGLPPGAAALARWLHDGALSGDLPGRGVGLLLVDPAADRDVESRRARAHVLATAFMALLPVGRDSPPAALLRLCRVARLPPRSRPGGATLLLRRLAARYVDAAREAAVDAEMGVIGIEATAAGGGGGGGGGGGPAGPAAGGAAAVGVPGTSAPPLTLPAPPAPPALPTTHHGFDVRRLSAAQVYELFVELLALNAALRGAAPAGGVAALWHSPPAPAEWAARVRGAVVGPAGGVPDCFLEGCAGELLAEGPLTEDGAPTGPVRAAPGAGAALAGALAGAADAGARALGFFTAALGDEGAAVVDAVAALLRGGGRGGGGGDAAGAGAGAERRVARD